MINNRVINGLLLTPFVHYQADKWYMAASLNYQKFIVNKLEKEHINDAYNLCLFKQTTHSVVTIISLKLQYVISNKLGIFVFTALLFTLCTILSCAQHTASEKFNRINTQAKTHQWKAKTIDGAYFDLVSFTPEIIQPHNSLTIYIEGDGLAWRNRFTPSNNPTPSDPIALKLAWRHPTNHVAYLARPCQYVSKEHTKHCMPNAWTHGRYGQNTIDATNTAIDVLKTMYQATSIELIGYSGGATIALLVAANRHDISNIITISGNTHPTAWVRHHAVSPLYSSLNPLDFQIALRHIPQVHLMGAQDKITPPHLTKQFADKLNNPNIIQLYTLTSFNHNCCWVASWPRLYFEAQNLQNKKHD